MPLIDNPDNMNLVAVTFRMPEKLKDEVKEYCKWAGPFKDGYFYTSALKYVLANDQEWQQELRRRSSKLKRKVKK